MRVDEKLKSAAALHVFPAGRQRKMRRGGVKHIAAGGAPGRRRSAADLEVYRNLNRLKGVRPYSPMVKNINCSFV